MKNFFLNNFGLKKDKKRKDSNAEDSTADGTTSQEPTKSKEKDSKHRRGSLANTSFGEDSTHQTSSSKAEGKAKHVDDGGAASTPSSASARKKSSSGTPAALHPLPPPPPPPPSAQMLSSSPSTAAAAGSSPGIQPNPAQLALQHTALDDSDDSTQPSAELFPAEQSDVSVLQIAEVFQVFRPFVDNCANAAVKQSSLAKLRKILPAIAAVHTTVTESMIEAQGFHPSFAIAPMLNHLLSQPAPLRARLCIAIFRFCGEMLEEVEDEMLSSETGLFSGLQAFNPNLNPAGDAASGASSGSGVNPAALARCPNIDLAKIYHNLLHKDDYLPTAEEMNEICLRVQDLLCAEPNVLLIGMPAVLVGDLHGQIRDLLDNVLPCGGPLVPPSVLAAAAAKSPNKKTKAVAAAANASCKSGTPASTGKAKAATSAKASSPSTKNPASENPDASVTYLFLGDYVDRGSNSLRIIAVLFTAKVLSPNTVFVLRGNHECANTNRFYGFLDECHRRYPIVNNKVTSLQLCTLSPSEEDAEDGESGAAGSSGNTNTSTSNNGDGARSTSSTEPTAQELIDSVEASGPDDMGWDMKDHPLWLVANETFKMLPLCAALYEELEEEERQPEGPVAPPPEDSASVGEKSSPISLKKAKRTATPSSSANASITSETLAKSPKLAMRKTPASTRNGISKSDDPLSGPPSRQVSSAATTVDAASKALTPNASFARPRKTRKVVRVCAMHGGLSPFVDDSFDGIIAINRFRAIERGALADLTWSDPASESVPRPGSAVAGHAAPQPAPTLSGSPALDDEIAEADAAGALPNSRQVPLSRFQSPCVFRGTAAGFTGNPRGTGHIFGEDITMDFVNTNHLYFVVRAHQCVHEGFQWTHHDRLLTVFSAPNYCGMRNKGAILLLDAQGGPTLEQYEYVDDSDNPLMCTASVPQPPKMFS